MNIAPATRSLPRVFDKYMLPKVAFVVITLASMVGVTLTGFRHGWSSPVILALRWAGFWTLALLLGSQMWKIFYLRPSVKMRPVDGAVAYGQAMLDLHRRWQQVLLPIALTLVGGNLVSYAGRFAIARQLAPVGGAFLGLTLIGMTWAWGREQDAQRQDLPSWLALAGLAGAMAVLGCLDVMVQPVGHGNIHLLALNRALHLWAFSAWLGGALWNIFIAVPAGLQRVNMDTVILANFQLERFRVVVRTVFPTIIFTGLVQAWTMFGWQWRALTSNLWGYLILTKLALIVVLVGVFIACPMWKACSPIRGVCDLDDL